MRDVRLEFLDGEIPELYGIYNEIAESVFNEYVSGYSLIAIGSAVSNNFSFNAEQKRKTLSDLELLVITGNKIGQQRLNEISCYISKNWFKESELFHIDIRETTEVDLYGRSNKLPFVNLEVISGEFKKEKLVQLASFAECPMEQLIDKNVYQIAIFEIVHGNRAVAVYLLVKLAIEIARSDFAPDIPSSCLMRIGRLKEAKKRLLMHELTSEDISAAKDIVRLGISHIKKEAYFDSAVLESMVEGRTVQAGELSFSTLERFLHKYYADANPQVDFFLNIYKIGQARAK